MSRCVVGGGCGWGNRRVISGIEKACFNTRIEELKEIQHGWSGGKERKHHNMRLGPGCGESSKTILGIWGILGTIRTRARHDPIYIFKRSLWKQS